MAKKKDRDSRRKKVRVQFRPNRASPARRKTWTDHSDSPDSIQADAPLTERLRRKGDLSRKRTITLSDEGQSLETQRRPGVVIGIMGQIVDVDDGRRTWPCTVRRVLRTRRIETRNAVAVGDRVQFTVVNQRDGQLEEGVIEAIEERRTVLVRCVAERQHVMVANVDQAVIVSASAEPQFKPHLVDRYIVAAMSGHMTPVVCINKIDMDADGYARRVAKRYRNLGYMTLVASAITGEGVDRLREVLTGKSSVIAGQSGVGKSSLLNAVQPGLKLKVGDLARFTDKGTHTTTTARLLKLEGGGYVVDTPGIRSLSLADVPLNELEQYFVEFVDRVAGCHFPNCSHLHEDRCAIKAAVEQGLIHPERYESYVRMFADR